MRNIFKNDLYVRVSKNKFEAQNATTQGEWLSAIAEEDFTTTRLLIGNFSSAEQTLKKLIKEIMPKGLIKKSPGIVIHPTMMVEGGLSQVEERIFIELCLGAGAHKAIIHLGNDLTCEEVIQKANSR
ncbi:hypothetical protein CLV44_11230 [Marinobacterium halophilum]|uniref:Uncharacterized protein n=1 Tax=Marinobacterium halophilum TaxID=267374 RepID=A0A2P8EVE6_9GAMM|nr:hypothetical protein [Marinobacterium halophilum]PSL13395.1 hypothetical protein CLV44_11230 [Marinobacterium halophilum]